MSREVKTQVKVQVGVEAIWKVLAKDFGFVIPKSMPNIIKDVNRLKEMVLLVSTMRHQKEKIVDLDESLHQNGMQVVEGEHLNLGFSSYKTTFQLAATGESSETLINFKVEYDIEAEETGMPEKTLKSGLAFIKHLDNYLLKQGT